MGLALRLPRHAPATTPAHAPGNSPPALFAGAARSVRGAHATILPRLSGQATWSAQPCLCSLGAPGPSRRLGLHAEVTLSDFSYPGVYSSWPRPLGALVPSLGACEHCLRSPYSCRVTWFCPPEQVLPTGHALDGDPLPGVVGVGGVWKYVILEGKLAGGREVQRHCDARALCDAWVLTQDLRPSARRSRCIE